MDCTFQAKWYVLYTRPRYEKKIVTAISFLHLHECYLPVQQSIKKWSDRIKKVDVPLFANYVFVRTTAAHRAILFDIPGVLRFVSFEGKAVTVADAEIEKIRLLEKSAGAQPEPYCTVGAQVMIKKGIFAGIQGILIRKLNHSRLVVRMPLLKQAISVNITEEDLLLV